MAGIMAQVGRPPIFDSAEQLQAAIDDYIQNPPYKAITVGKGENTTTYKLPMLTITGLAYHLGFESRQSFYDYENKPEFSYTVKRARLFIEGEYEKLLIDGNTVGAIFALKNFGWIDKQALDHTTNGKDIEPQIIFRRSNADNDN